MPRYEYECPAHGRFESAERDNAIQCPVVNCYALGKRKFSVPHVRPVPGLGTSKMARDLEDRARLGAERSREMEKQRRRAYRQAARGK